jgi:P27 family predicted phage terminase small subunit
MSRRPKPTAQKKLHGNPGRRPLNDAEPAVEGRTSPPAWLDKIARQEWRRLAPRLHRLGILTPADRVAFANRCAAYSRLVRAETFLASQSSLKYKTKGGALKPWPEIAIATTAAEQVRKFDIEFGLTPAARTRLRVDVKQKKDKTRDFLFGSGEKAKKPANECENVVEFK